MSVRIARPADAAGILEIYRPIVLETPISFETEPPSEREMSERIRRGLEAYAWLVWEERGEVMGYAYASSFRSRPAYRWSAEVSVYVREDARGRGIARGLYEPLLDVLRGQGYLNALAGIGLPNPASVRLHESLGFEYLGTYRRVGFKLGAWHDVGWWQITLADHPDEPTEPVPFSECRQSLGG